MKSIRLIVLCALLCGLCQMANAQLMFRSTLHDFGQIAEGQTVTHAFPFKNVGKDPVRIRPLKAACGCTTPSWPRGEIAPGAEEEIRITFNSKNREGPFTKTLTVDYSDEFNQIILVVKGEVVAAADASADEYTYKDTMGNLAFDRVRYMPRSQFKSNQPQQLTYHFKNVGTETIALQGVKELPPYFSATYTPEKLEPGQEGQITLTWHGEKAVAENLPNGHNINVAFKFATTDTELPYKVLFVGGMFERFFSEEELAEMPQISFEKTEFDGGDLIAGEKLTYKFRFTNSGGSPLRITNVKASCGCTASKPESEVIQPGESSYITATFNSRGRRGRQHKTITVRSNDPKNGVVVLHLRANVVQDPFGGGGGGSPVNSGAPFGN